MKPLGRKRIELTITCGIQLVGFGRTLPGSYGPADDLLLTKRCLSCWCASRTVAADVESGCCWPSLWCPAARGNVSGYGRRLRLRGILRLQRSSGVHLRRNSDLQRQLVDVVRRGAVSTLKSATYPTRLETRTKESNMCASQWVANSKA